MTDVLPDGVSTYKDRHGKDRYRFRQKGKPTRSLPGQPGDERFEAAYRLALAGVPTTKAKAGRRGIVPRTLRAAWLEVQQTMDWKALKASSKTVQVGVAERFFESPIAKGSKTTFGAMPFDGLRRGDVKKILGRYGEHPHAGEAVLRLLRKLSLVALDLEWIENDPTYRIKFRPKLIGHRSWRDGELEQYEKRWATGTMQRLGYALALYTGQRREDVAPMQWQAYDGVGIFVRQEKTDAPLWIPVHPLLKIELDAAPRINNFILNTAYGNPFSVNGFGNKMAKAIGAADLPDDCRLHGLRKSAGRCLAEAGATTKMIQAILGHKTLAESERYTREADQRRLAQGGIDAWVARPRLVVVK